MYCNHCGNQIPDGSQVCNFCGQNQGMGYGNPYQAGGYPISPPRRRIDNIFTALIYQRTPGVIMEFTLWCIVCFVVMLSLIAAVLGDANITWILLMVFSIGLAVLQAFRLKPITMLYSACTFHLIIFIVHYACFAKTESHIGDASYSALNIILFILLLLLAAAIVTCSTIHFFSRINLSKLLSILVLVYSGLVLILQILMYALSHLGSDAPVINEYVRKYLDYEGYWIGTISFWFIYSVIAILYVFFFSGFIDNTKDKIWVISGMGHSFGGNPGLRGICGMYAGQVMYLQGKTVTIGSGAGVMLLIQDKHVSGQHCAIRFNSASGCYEVYDNSTNGVYIKNGSRLPKGQYSFVQRGSILCIGSMEQQFQLM